MRCKLTKAQWEEIRDELLKAPNNTRLIANKLKVGFVTVKRAWSQGWPEDHYPPVKDLMTIDVAAQQVLMRGIVSEDKQAQAIVDIVTKVEQTSVAVEVDHILRTAREQAKAILDQAELEAIGRKQLISQEEQDRRQEMELEFRSRFTSVETAIKKRIADLRQAARIDVIEAKAQEAITIRGLKGNSVRSLGMTSTLLSITGPIAEKLITYYKKVIEDQTPMTQAEAERGVEMLHTLIKIVKDVNSATMDAIKAEHLILGKPTEITTAVDGKRIDDTKAKHLVGVAERAIQRATGTGGKLIPITSGVWTKPPTP